VQDVAATRTKTSKRNMSNFTRSMQTEVQRSANALIPWRHEHTMAPTLGFAFKLRISLARGNFSSVRGYGLRTYKPRQGRNAATVV
jgi:uncharacterized protein YfdQ (DUF2303 family)